MLKRALALGIVFFVGLIAVYAGPTTISSQTGARSKGPAESRLVRHLAVLSPIPANAQAETESGAEQSAGALYLRAFAPAGAENAGPFPKGSDARPGSMDEPAAPDSGPGSPADPEAESSGPDASNGDADAQPEEGVADEEETGPERERMVSDRSGVTSAAIAARFRHPTEISGIATYYHPSLAGGLMANGRPYDPSAMTAASNRWPLGTLLRVTHNRSIVVEITDRGNFTHALDLSSGAFRALAGTLAPGVISVTIEEDEWN